MRRRAFIAGLGAGAVALPTITRAQTYPTRPVTIVALSVAGSMPDITARLVGQALSRQLGQSFIIDNRPGAGGNLALQAVARAPADGYTLLEVGSPHAVNVTLYEKNPVTITRDIIPVASINDAPFVLEVNPSFPAKNVAEFIAYAKAHPGKVNLASGPPGQMTHLCGELLRMMTGIDILPVPFRGPPAAQSAVIAGDAHGMFDAVGASLPLIQAGSLRALGVTASARLRVLPDTPIIAETVPGYTVTAFLGFGAPKGTPPEIIELLNREVNAALSDPAVKTRMAELGAEILAG